MSVGTTSALAVRPDHLGHLVQSLLGARDQHEVGPELRRLLAQRPPQPGPDPGQHDDLPLQQLRYCGHVRSPSVRRAGDGCTEIRGERAMDVRRAYIECPVGVLGRVSSARSAGHEIILRAMPTWRSAIRAVYSSAVTWWSAKWGS